MAIDVGGVGKRVDRLKELAAKMEAEWGRVHGKWGSLSAEEHRSYVEGVRAAVDGLERARLVLVDALERMDHRAA